MGIYETYSKRLRKRERAGQPDVYQNDDLPDALRVQIIHIWNSTIGSGYVEDYDAPGSQSIYGLIKRTFCKEMGVFSLTGSQHDSDEKQCKGLLLNGSTLQALDIIEFSFRLIGGLDTIYNSSDWPPNAEKPADTIGELNYRFREHGVGYQFEGGEIVRVDSQYVHAEAVKPTISLLNTAGFGGASDEFLKAHEHYRKGRNGEAMTEALKAFESTMKAILDKNE